MELEDLIHLGACALLGSSNLAVGNRRNVTLNAVTLNASDEKIASAVQLSRRVWTQTLNQLREDKEL